MSRLRILFFKNDFLTIDAADLLHKIDELGILRLVVSS